MATEAGCRRKSAGSLTLVFWLQRCIDRFHCLCEFFRERLGLLPYSFRRKVEALPYLCIGNNGFVWRSGGWGGNWGRIGGRGLGHGSRELINTRATRPSRASTPAIGERITLSSTLFQCRDASARIERAELPVQRNKTLNGSITRLLAAVERYIDIIYSRTRI
jgi:hypothetical protein